jgi:hypothetical protein
VGCGESKEEKAAKVKAAAAEAKATAESKKSAKVIEAAIRNVAGKPTGELTKADLEKLRVLFPSGEGLTDVKGLEKLSKQGF